MNKYEVTITPPPAYFKNCDELQALYTGTTKWIVQCRSPERACDLAQLMIPWKLRPLYFAVDARVI